MTRRMISSTFVCLLALGLGAGAARGHITPPVVLASDRDVLLELLRGAQRFFVREVRLSPDERQVIQQQAGWTPDEDFYRFYLGRDTNGQLVAATVFLTEFTIHGPVRVAVGVGPDGKIRGARVVELTEETYPWLKPLLDRDFTRRWVGQGSRDQFTLAADAGGNPMTEFYGGIIASLIQRGALLYEVAVAGRPAAFVGSRYDGGAARTRRRAAGLAARGTARGSPGRARGLRQARVSQVPWDHGRALPGCREGAGRRGP